VPHSALGAELTLDHHERTRVFAASKLFAGAGVLLCLTALALVVGEESAGQRTGMLWVALFAGLLLPALALAATSQLRERPEHWGRGPEAVSAAIRDVWANPMRAAC
jgi:Na+/melibiose symporter-like transporter